MSLIAFGIGQASVIFGQSLIEVIGQYHLGQARYIFGSHWNYYHHSLIGVINCYHHLMNKNIQRYWINKLLYLVILIDEHHCLDEQC